MKYHLRDNPLELYEMSLAWQSIGAKTAAQKLSPFPTSQDQLTE